MADNELMMMMMMVMVMMMVTMVMVMMMRRARTVFYHARCEYHMKEDTNTL